MTRDEMFKQEQTECVDRLRKMINAVCAGDMREVHRWLQLVKISVEYMDVNAARSDRCA